MECWQPRGDSGLYFQSSVYIYSICLIPTFSSFHVCSCTVVILNWSSVTSMTGWKFFHYTKERPMLRITRRMRKSGWWENTRYHRLGGVLPNCVGVFCETEMIAVYTFLPQGSFLVYPIDLEEDENTNCQITKGIPPNSAIKVLVRVYIIKVSSWLLWFVYF